MRWAVLIVGLLGLSPVPACGDPALDALLAAYPAHLTRHQGNDLIWSDGTRLPFADEQPNKSFAERLKRPSIKDQFAVPYPLTWPLRAPALDEDPGRFRNEPFFIKMYGDCRRGEVEGRLKRVPWLADRGGGTLLVTGVNDVAGRLAEVVQELHSLPAAMMPYLIPSAGTYNCRFIAGTRQLSVHAFGAAIDLSSKFGDYWRWSSAGNPVWRNRIPEAIVRIFEQHGFIWGGRWYHFDTLHFEYRPELMALAKQSPPARDR